jgi:hypothetical protein
LYARHGSLIAAALLLLSAPKEGVAQDEEWVCPAPDKVALLARTPGWISQDTLSYPYLAPVLRFERMRTAAVGPSAGCQYRVENSGLLNIYKFGTCEAGKGTWKSLGQDIACESPNVAECTLRCKPK